MLSGAINWVGKQAKLSTNLVSLGEGWWLISQAITEGHIKPGGPGHLSSIPPASTPFNFSNQGLSLWPASLPTAAAWWEVPRHGPRPGYQEWCQTPQQGWDWDCVRSRLGGNELWATPPPLPLPSPDHGFESDQGSASTSSWVSLRSKTLGGSRHPCHGQQPHQESRGHMKINLPVFKDEDTKDTITYQSWQWDLTMYHHAWCQDCTLLPMLFVPCKVTQVSWWEVQGQTSPWMMYSLYWMSTITMSRPWMLWIRSSFSYAWVKKRQYQTGGVPVKTPAGSYSVIPRIFSSRPCSKAEAWQFLWWTP